MSDDAVSLIQDRLRSVAAAYGYPHARISLFPTLLIVALREGEPAMVRTIDSVRQLRLDQASEVIAVARLTERAELAPAEALAKLREILASRPRFGPAAYIASHGVLTIGLGLVIHPAAVELWVYAALGILVGAMKVWAQRRGATGYLLAVVAAAVVSAIAFLSQGGDEAASLRLTIPPLVTFLPGALLTMATVDLAMGETITGASRFVAGLLQLALLAIGIVVGAELVGDPSSGPIAGSAETLGWWSPWVGVAIFGLGVYVHNCAPKGSLGWLLVVLFTAWIGQLAGERILDPALSGFVGAAVMVPVAHLVARAAHAPPAHVMFLPAFWLLVPGAIGLIGITEIVGENADAGSENFVRALVSVPSIALGILVGTMIVRAGARFGIVRVHLGESARLCTPRAGGGVRSPVAEVDTGTAARRPRPRLGITALGAGSPRACCSCSSPAVSPSGHSVSRAISITSVTRPLRPSRKRTRPARTWRRWPVRSTRSASRSATPATSSRRPVPTRRRTPRRRSTGSARRWSRSRERSERPPRSRARRRTAVRPDECAQGRRT